MKPTKKKAGAAEATQTKGGRLDRPFSSQVTFRHGKSAAASFPFALGDLVRGADKALYLVGERRKPGAPPVVLSFDPMTGPGKPVRKPASFWRAAAPLSIEDLVDLRDSVVRETGETLIRREWALATVGAQLARAKARGLGEAGRTPRLRCQDLAGPEEIAIIMIAFPTVGSTRKDRSNAVRRLALPPFNMHRNRVYRIANALGWRSGRKTRSDKGTRKPRPA